MRADGVPDRLQPVEVTIDLVPPGVQLEPAIGLALLERRLDDARRILVPGDRPVHLDALAERAAEQRRRGHTGVTAGHVEERRVNGRERERRETEHPRERVEQRDALKRVASHERGRNARLNELDDRRLRLGRERLDRARLPPAHDPLVGDDANQHVRRARPVGHPEPEDLLERGRERNRFDALDPHIW